MKSLKSFVAMTAGALALSIVFTSMSYAQNKTPELSDPEIASVAVTANQIDVNYAEIALKKSKNQKVKDFATNMKNDHNAVIKMAVDLAKKLGVIPQTNAVTKSLLEGEKKTTQMLNSKSGKAFDKTYIDNEVTYHKAVINAVEKLLIPQADNAELKAILQKVLPILKTHLHHAEMVQAELK